MPTYNPYKWTDALYWAQDAHYTGLKNPATANELARPMRADLILGPAVQW